MRICFVLKDESEYKQIKDLSIFKSENIAYGKIFNSTDHLVSALSGDRTDLVIADADMPGQDIFEILGSVRSQRDMGIIFIIPEPSFEYVYKALKLGALDVIVRPYSQLKLSDTIIEASQRLRSRIPEYSVSSTSRELFADQLSSIIDGKRTLEDINAAFHTTFRSGIFQVITIAIDYDDLASIPSIAADIWHSIRIYLSSKCPFSTYDMLYSISYNEIRIVLNFPEDSKLPGEYDNIYREAQLSCSDISGLKLFMGVGRPYNNYGSLPVSSEESKVGIWKRMASPSSGNRITYFNEESVPDNCQKNVLKWDRAIKAAIDTLDVDAFKSAVTGLFAMSPEVLCSSFSRHIILNHIKYVRDIYKDKIDLTTGASNFYYSTKMKLLSSKTLDEYKRRYIAAVEDIFKSLQTESKSSQERYISRARAIVESKYMENITLVSVAEEIGISSSYLSRLFKSFSAESFSDYLTKQRLSAAKDYLTDTDYKIKEICNLTGFTDQRYFSRVFSAAFGVTPSEYRAIHSK